MKKAVRENENQQCIKKESPNEGTETYQTVLHNNDHPRIKKESPNEGTETAPLPLMVTVSSYKKRIPE